MKTQGQNPEGVRVAANHCGNDAAMSKLAASELRYRRLFESAKDGILILDAESGVVVDANPFLTDLLGFSRAEILDKRVWELGFLKHLAANAGKFAELQAQKLEAVGRLAGGVAHDFNNLLMGIMGYAELCLDEIVAGHPARQWLDEIMRAAERSAEITRQLLAFARKQTIAPQVLDLNAAAAGMLNLLQRMIGEDIKLTWRPAAGLQAVKIDPSQVSQILTNLCVNARDAIAGVGKIIIETRNVVMHAADCTKHAEALPGRYACLSVSDTGSGMEKETLAQIFEPFFSTKGPGRGTGLGMATVYGIVKQNHGFVYASSEPGKGTTIKVHLPVVEAEDANVAVASHDEAPQGRGEQILLVEDERPVRVTCGLFLKSLGYQVLVADAPDTALRLATAHPGEIHLLLTDVVMPGMDGRQLAIRIREMQPHVAVLFMSGYTADVIARRGVLDAGVDFLAKPFTRGTLARRVRAVLDAHDKPSVAMVHCEAGTRPAPAGVAIEK
jgi:two-component system, cell cycle sensor histidine kinase and response regulator CckA